MGSVGTTSVSGSWSTDVGLETACGAGSPIKPGAVALFRTFADLPLFGAFLCTTCAFSFQQERPQAGRLSTELLITF